MTHDPRKSAGVSLSNIALESASVCLFLSTKRGADLSQTKPRDLNRGVRNYVSCAVYAYFIERTSWMDREICISRMFGLPRTA